MILIDGKSLTSRELYSVSVKRESVEISDQARKEVARSREELLSLLKVNKKYYGINTGFGSLYDMEVGKEDLYKLQINLIRSHASGVGDPLPEAIVRGMLLVRINSLIKGYSGVSVDLIDHSLRLLNSGLYPYVPSYGSLGASGDLAPLAHIALVIIGEGEVIMDGQRKPAAEALKTMGLEPYQFMEKEGVAFINGTSAITSILGIQTVRLENLIKSASGSAMLFFESLGGNENAFSTWVMDSRNHSGQQRIAQTFRKLLSDRPQDEKTRPKRLQDPYTIRCMPQIFGAVLDTLDYCRSVAEKEMNSVTDNPLVHNGEIISAGNFHGEPVALVSDFLCFAATDLGNLLERQLARLTDASLSGLPPFLTEYSGLNSGYMIPQYVAASLCNMNKVLSYPASADSIPTSANQEDHVSMGMTAALKLKAIIDNMEQLVSIHLLLSAQAFELSKVKGSSFSRGMLALLRDHVPALKEDRPVYRDIEFIREMIATNPEKINSRIEIQGEKINA